MTPAWMNPAERATFAGFSGQRAVSTWVTRMRRLLDLGFIDAKSGASGQFNYVVVWNPYAVVRDHRDAATPGLDPALYRALVAETVRIGANDLVD